MALLDRLCAALQRDDDLSALQFRDRLAALGYRVRVLPRDGGGGRL
jgi:hypothetical protein